MNKINVQILFTKEEFSQLQMEANKVGLTVPLYIRGTILKNDSFTTYYNELIEKVDALSSGTKFNIKALFGVDWVTIDKGVKLNLGKTFVGRVNDNIVTNVVKVGTDSSNIMWYEKK